MNFTVGKTIRFPSLEAMNRAFATGDMSEATYEENEFSALSSGDEVMVTSVDHDLGEITTDTCPPTEGRTMNTEKTETTETPMRRRERQIALMAEKLRAAYFASTAGSADGRFRDVAAIVVDLVDDLVQAAILAMPEKGDEEEKPAP